MGYNIIELVETRRGCGYRKPGGLYLVANTGNMPCGKLPVALPDRCPCCGSGIQFTRGFQWVSSLLIDKQPCTTNGCSADKPFGGCFPFGPIKKYGLMWVGKVHYPSSVSFEEEMKRVGISKRIAQVPKDFVVGVDWILLAHLQCRFVDEQDSIDFRPGIFSAFCPQRIEYVVRPTDPPSTLQAKADRGITLVRITRDHAINQLELGPQGQAIPDYVLQFAHDLASVGHDQTRLGRVYKVSKQAISRRVNDYRRDYAQLFPRHKRGGKVP